MVAKESIPGMPMIPLLPLRLQYRTDRPVTLPAFPGSTWRSALGYRLRRASCVTGADQCDGCLVAAHCAYGQLFETPTAALAAQHQKTPSPSGSVTGAGLLQAYPSAPHPFILSPVSSGGHYPAGATLEVEFILLAPALRWTPTLLPVLRNLQLQRSALTLEAVSRVNMHEPTAPHEPLTPQDLLTITDLEMPTPPPPTDPVTIELMHPLRLRQNGRYVGAEEFAFGSFVSALLRRASMLSSLTAQPPDIDFGALTKLGRSVELSRSALRWFDWHRHSTRQGRRVPMGGVVGQFQPTSVPEPLWPWLWLGQWLHVGKGAVMGMGRYRLGGEKTYENPAVPDGAARPVITNRSN